MATVGGALWFVRGSWAYSGYKDMVFLEINTVSIPFYEELSIEK